MSGKLIMKRKLDTSHITSSCNTISLEESSASSSSTLSTRVKHNNQNNGQDNSSIVQPDNKRLRCDTPPSEPEDSSVPPLPQATERNRHLLETIQLKILELQNELDEFEHDVEAHEEVYNYRNEQLQNNQIGEQQAEALGFAMCAQETMLFLQREGIPSDSVLYTRLRDALIGRSQADEIFHL